MFRFPELFAPRVGRAFGLFLLACSGFGMADASDKYPGVGRAATPKEVAAWDIDVRPDFKGLPAGSGSVAQGQDIWEAKCASCHGVFGESNQVFSPLVGGTTEQDLRTGRVARLGDPAYPSRTTLMKVATLSTLWDYQPGYALEPTQVSVGQRGVCRDRLHAQPGQRAARQLHAVGPKYG